MPLTRPDLIRIAAAADGRTEYDVQQKLKAPKVWAALQPIEEVRPSVVRKFEFREAVRLQLLIAAHDAGVKYDDIHLVSAALNRPLGLGEWPDAGLATMTGLDAIIAAAEQGESADLYISTGYENGRKRHRVMVALADYTPSPERAWNALDLLEGCRPVANVSIPASDMAAAALALR